MSDRLDLSRSFAADTLVMAFTFSSTAVRAKSSPVAQGTPLAAGNDCSFPAGHLMMKICQWR